MNRRYPWKPVPVRELSVFRGLRYLLGKSAFEETGEWKCTKSLIDTYDLPDPIPEMCRMYHRTRTAAERHCAKLQRAEPS